MHAPALAETRYGGRNDRAPELACVVLARNTCMRCREVLESLVSQSVRPEIVLVNSDGGDPFPLAELFDGKVKVIHHGGRLARGAARNLGVAATTASRIAFLASDCAAGPGWARRRIEAHRRFDVVSGEISDPADERLCALAAHLLLRSERRMGDGLWDRCCLSYSRSLFQRYGPFREDLSGGEDEEFHQRFGAAVETFHCREHGLRRVRPTGSAEFIREQYLCGIRTRETLTEAGREGSASRVSKLMLRRLRGTYRRYREEAAGHERLRAGLALPLLVLGAAAYGVGAGALSRGRPREAANTVSDDTEAYALLQVRNGMRFLPGYLDNLGGKVAGVIALDDGSTDGSREFLERSPLVRSLVSNPAHEPHRWDEVANRRKLVEAAQSEGAEWVIAMDVDERLPGDFQRRLKIALRRARSAGILAFAVWMRELWDHPDRYRADGIWGGKRVARLFNVRVGEDYDGSELHGQWAPANGRRGGRYPQADLEIFHLSMIDRRDRVRRRRKYERLDPDRRWQAIGYEYLTDERGCICQVISRRAMYHPVAQGTELNPDPPRVLALLAFHNESRFLHGYLDNVAPQVDGIVALDDGSTDGSADIIRSHPKVLEMLSNPVVSPHRWDETANQRRLVRAAVRHDPDWLLVVDADERLERNFRDRANVIVRRAEARGTMALSLAFRELWGSGSTYRVDGAWGKKRKASLFKYRNDHQFDERPMHNYWAPLNSRINGEYVHADLELYHLRMINPEDRELRRRRYAQMDPDREWQPKGYGYLVDETGIELRAPATGRHYL